MQLPEKNTQNHSSPKTSKNIIKHEARVQSAGQWARVLGWLILFTIPLYGLINLAGGRDTSETLGIYVFAVPAAIYLLISGKYIFKMGGKTLLPLLIINAIVSVFFIGGLIPILAVITSIIGAVSFSKLKKLKVVHYGKEKATLSAVEIIVLVVIVIAGFTTLLYATNQTSSSMGLFRDSSADTMIEYNSVEHGFKISFPGANPEIEHSTVQEGDASIPYTSYSKDNTDGTIAYLVGVYDFTSFDSIDQRAGLEGGLNGAVQNTQDASLVSSSFGTFMGLESIDGHYTVPSEGNTYDAYMKAFFYGGKMYALFTIGTTESEAAAYANTFGFTQ